MKAFDFTSESFALEYTEQMTSSSVRRGAQEFLPGASSCQPPRTRRVPQDHKTIQEALDAGLLTKPADFDYQVVKGLSNEVKQKLNEVQATDRFINSNSRRYKARRFFISPIKVYP